MEEHGVPQPIPGQIEIDVPPSERAIGRWTAEDEFAAYAREKGVEKALEQKRRVEESKTCNCGVQVAEDARAREEKRHSLRVPGHAHKSGCPCLRERSGGSARISQDEQARRYHEAEGGSR